MDGVFLQLHISGSQLGPSELKLPKCNCLSLGFPCRALTAVAFGQPRKEVQRNTASSL